MIFDVCFLGDILLQVLEHKMPAGVPTGTYMKGVLAAVISTFAGSQTVHLYYRPLDVSMRLPKSHCFYASDIKLPLSW